MAEEWFTYKQLAERLNVSPGAARHRAVRQGLPRRTGSDGKTVVLVDPVDLVASGPPSRSGRMAPSAAAAVAEPPAGDVEALESHIGVLKGMVARAETLAESYRDRADGGRQRAEALRASTEAARATGEAERDRADTLAAQIHELLSVRRGEQETSTALEPQVEELRAIVHRMINGPRWWRRPPP